MADNLTLEQQYQEQVIRLAGAQRMLKVVHGDRVNVWDSLTKMLANLQGISSPAVKEAALEFSNTPGGDAVAAFDRLSAAIEAYRPEAENNGEGELLAKLERILHRLLGHHSKLSKQEAELDREAMQYRAEALRIKALLEKGPGGIH